MFSNLIPLYMYVGVPLGRPRHLYDYVLARQGIIKRVENRHLAVDALLAPIEAELIGLRLQPYPLRELRLNVPRLPGRLLAQMLADARQNMGREVMYHARFSAGAGWRITRPRQEQSWTRVGYREVDPHDIVLECHSHHTMPAFFSGTDDRDEQGGRLYAVMGHLDRDTPQLALRAGLYGHWLYDLPALTIFDDIGPFVETHLPPEPATTGWSLGSLLNWRSS